VLKKIKIILVFALFAVFCLVITVKADYSNTNEAWDMRNGADTDDWIEMGSGLVSGSPDDERAIQLTGGGQDSIPGMATSVYYFEPPVWTKAFRIKIRYYDDSGDDEIAGRVFIKTNDNDSRQTSDELFYGDTYILRTSQNSEIIRVSAERYIENGIIEVHVVASGQDQLTVESLEMEYLRETPQVKIVHEYHNDYWDYYPRYHYWYNYWYWSPHHYWPHRFHYVVWIIPGNYYWHTWRHWCRHHINIWCGHHPKCWRRYTIVYNDPWSRDHRAKINRRSRIHERLVKEYTVRNKTDVVIKEKRNRDDQRKYQKETGKYPIDVTQKSQRFTKRDSEKYRDTRVIDKEKARAEKEFRESKEKKDVKIESRSQVKERKEIRKPRIDKGKKTRADRTMIKHKDKTERTTVKNFQSTRIHESSKKSYKAPAHEKSTKSQSSREAPKVKTERKRK